MRNYIILVFKRTIEVGRNNTDVEYLNGPKNSENVAIYSIVLLLDPIAQQVEHYTFNVGFESLSGITKYIK